MKLLSWIACVVITLGIVVLLVNIEDASFSNLWYMASVSMLMTGCFIYGMKIIISCSIPKPPIRNKAKKSPKNSSLREKQL